MKKIINGKKYDTETATKLTEWDNGHYASDFQFCAEILYRTPRGGLFLVGEGGAMSQYASHSGNNSGYGSEFRPMNEKEAREWCEERGIDGGEVEKIFGEIEDAGPDETVMIGVSRKLRDALKMKCAGQGRQIKETVEALMKKYIEE